MLIYQVKIEINPSVESEWFQWMKTVHVPDLLKTGLVSSSQIWKEDIDQPTYYFNYVFQNSESLIHYQSNHAPALRADVIRRYEGQFTASRKVFEIL